jgi:hypothetical protein
MEFGPAPIKQKPVGELEAFSTPSPEEAAGPNDTGTVEVDF